MLAGILTFLTAIAPLITALGLKLIEVFVSNQAAQDQAKQDFLQAIQAHVNDALQSVATRMSAKQQSDDLDKIAAQLDAPVPPPVDPPKT